ncbi:hypothetical protein [Streptomyces sp. DSM 40750]|uniref:hypothetical protein n=1 Tax=Streptomyces sp. DSM 40750 TaxID=2801030 RepID=UPI00214AB7EC|nr:hypothetical protein [Streptomyces sp. DSM 40750]UUU23185.1 hypothetical protein JIX55_24440 [Streptomyces sp. DSM 40750]
MRALVVRLCEALLRWAAPSPLSPDAEEPLEPGPPPRHQKPVEIWPFEPYDNLVRPYVLSPEELYARGMEVSA